MQVGLNLLAWTGGVVKLVGLKNQNNAASKRRIQKRVYLREVVG